MRETHRATGNARGTVRGLRSRHSLLRAVVVVGWTSVLFLPFSDFQSSVVLFFVVFGAIGLVMTLRSTGVAEKLRRLHVAPALALLPADRLRKLRAGAAPALIALLVTVPFVLKDYYLDVLIMAGIYALLAIGLNVIVGFAGLLNLGFAAFYAIGAYAYALLNTTLGLSFWTCLPLSALLASCAGLVLAVPALRLRGDYLAIVTLGFGEIVRLVLNNWDSVTKGPNGITGIAAPHLMGVSLGTLDLYYYVVLVFVVLSVVITRRIKYSRIGRAWIALRENEIAAASMGINATVYKIYAFSFGTFWAGIAGILFAAKMRFVSPESFTFLESILIISMVILGGIGSVYGAVLGALILVILPEVLRELQLYRMLILGVGLVLLMIYKPQGLLGGARNASAGS
jgi:branched-chain amino acid transport system permease protein